MNDKVEAKKTGVLRGGNDRNRNGKRSLWIVLALAAAVVGVLIARNAGRPTEAGSSVSSAPPASVATNNVSKAVANPDRQGQALPRLLDLGAKSCVPCKMMAPILAELKSDYAQWFRTEFIDVWQNPDAAGEYGIRVIPTQIFYDASGQELHRHEGFLGKNDILAKWKEHGVALPQTVE